MSRAPFLAVADDLTGAAEIAAFGFRHGLDSVVVIDANAQSGGAELVVYDSDSRLDEPPVAAEKLSSLGRLLAQRPRKLIYKKTDSVLRGSVRVEIESLAGALGLPRALLLPANPTLGRTIRDGHYAIAGVPLHQTTFANDPQHPAKSASVLTLLGEAGSLPIVVKSATDALPSDGIIVCNATSAVDVQMWARLVTSRDLPAGGGEFFSALLGQREMRPPAPSASFAPLSPTLIVSGTTSSAGATLRENARRDGVAIVPMPFEVAATAVDATAAITAWIESARALLITKGAAMVVYDGPLTSDPHVAGSIRRAFARCVRELVNRGIPQHVIVEGGATAASIARESGWRELRLAHEWAHGVASLRPANHPSLVMTMKPGSYAWPPALWAHILRSRPADPAQPHP